MSPLYDAVAAGMWAYTNAAFRVRVLGRERLRVRPGTILAVTHRRETDVPLVCPPLFYGSGMRRNRAIRMSFAARQDLFEPGFFAGFPRSVPAPVRRALWRLDISPFLRDLTLHPVRSAALVRLVDVVRLEPELELGAFPDALRDAVAQRAHELRLREPRLARDVDRGEYADILWRTFGRDELAGEAFKRAWHRHGIAAARDFRSLVEVLRGGGVLLLFPEGRPSPDGEIGPLERGLEALVRRGEPAWIQPVGLAYDPLARGRTHGLVSFGEPFEPGEDLAATVLGRLKLAVPLTAGQIVAAARTEGRQVEADAAVADAREEGRDVAPELRAAPDRRRRIAEAEVEAGRASARDLAFLAREYRSSRER